MLLLLLLLWSARTWLATSSMTARVVEGSRAHTRHADVPPTPTSYKVT